MTNEAVTLRDDTIITSAVLDRTFELSGRKYGKKHDIQVVQDGWGDRDIFAVYHQCATIPALIVSENSFEAAWSLMVDNMPTIAPEEVEEAERVEMNGYTYQDNATGTGIVYTGDLAMVWVTRSRLRDQGLKLKIARDE